MSEYNDETYCASRTKNHSCNKKLTKEILIAASIANINLNLSYLCVADEDIQEYGPIKDWCYLDDFRND